MSREQKDRFSRRRRILLAKRVKELSSVLGPKCVSKLDGIPRRAAERRKADNETKKKRDAGSKESGDKRRCGVKFPRAV